MKHLSEAIPEIVKQMATHQIRPEGTIAFKLSSEKLFDRDIDGGVIFEVGSEAHVFRLVREKEPVLSYYHWSPGTGGRVARVDLSSTTEAATVQIVFTWHPKKIQLFVVPVSTPGAKELFAEGQPTSRTFRTTKHGEIVQVGDEGIKLLDIRLHIGDIPILLPTALENWQATEKSCDVLQRGKSDDGYMFEVVKNNSVLTKLITGFETYCKTRLIELEKEGVQPDLQQLAEFLAFKSEDKKTLVQVSIQTAHLMGASALELWLNHQRRINFQEFDKAKKAFNKAYRLKFGELGVSGDDIAKLKVLFTHRHRVIHVSPIATLIWNNDPASGKQLLVEAPDLFKVFIKKLHEATLSLGV